MGPGLRNTYLGPWGLFTLPGEVYLGFLASVQPVPQGRGTPVRDMRALGHKP